MRGNRLIYLLLRLIILTIFRLRFHLRFIDPDGVRRLRPPFVLVANHANFYDPCFIATYFSSPVRFVTSDNILRGGLLAKMVRLCGAIPKTKFMPDRRSLRRIVQAIDAGDILGLFPEGRRSWDGRTIAIMQETARLVVRLGVPVVAARISGSYLAKPRWSRQPNRGAVTVRYSLLLSAQGLQRQSVAEVQTAIQRAIDHDDLMSRPLRPSRRAHQSRQPRPDVPDIGRPACAEWIESLLFYCIRCQAIASLRSRGAQLVCTRCGPIATYRSTDMILLDETVTSQRIIHPADWNRLQLEHLRQLLANSASATPLFSDEPIHLATGRRDQPLVALDSGRLDCHRDHLQFTGRRIGTITLPMESIRGVNVQHGERLEFYVDWRLHCLYSSDPRVSIYKWYKAIDISQQQ